MNWKDLTCFLFIESLTNNWLWKHHIFIQIILTWEILRMCYHGSLVKKNNLYICCVHLKEIQKTLLIRVLWFCLLDTKDICIQLLKALLKTFCDAGSDPIYIPRNKLQFFPPVTFLSLWYLQYTIFNLWYQTCFYGIPLFLSGLLLLFAATGFPRYSDSFI